MSNVFMLLIIIVLALFRVNGASIYYWIIPAAIGWLIGTWMVGRVKVIDASDNPQVTTFSPLASIYFYTAILLIIIEIICATEFLTVR